MNKTDRRNPSAPPAPAPPHRPGTLDEAQALFESMLGEAKRRSQFEREEVRSRGPLARVLLVLTIAAALLSAATMLYGVYHFPDAPNQAAGRPVRRKEWEAAQPRGVRGVHPMGKSDVHGLSRGFRVRVRLRDHGRDAAAQTQDLGIRSTASWRMLMVSHRHRRRPVSLIGG